MNNKGHYLRLLTVGIFFLLLLLTVIFRTIDLTVLHRQFLKGQGDARSLRTQAIPAYRGMITDRQGTPLAVSTPVQSVWVNPKEFAPEPQKLAQLAKILNISEKNLGTGVTKAANREFLYLKRQLPPAEARKIEELDIPGVNFQQEFKRFYPEGESTAQLLGFTNIDDAGIEGLELAWQEWLMGMEGSKRVVKDRTGRVIEELGVLRESRPGHDLALSIDRRIQYLAMHELKNTLDKFAAKAGSVIVLDSQSGEILAAVNSPSFNPNARGRYTRDRYRNKAITDTFEPGSVLKPFSIASALSSGLYKPGSIIDTRPGWMTVQGKPIRDIHNYGVLDVTGVLQHSSNIGVSKMVLSSPPEQYINLLKRMGFAQRTESGYPGESDGSMVDPREAKPFVLATLSFGYGISVTALQLAKAYMVFANHGSLLPVSLLHSDTHEPGEQVLDPRISDQVLSMLEAVVAGEEGTGKQARIPGYRVAGKTGTARIAGKNGYQEKRYIASFAGIAPVSKPRLIVVAIVYEPTKNGYYATAVAAPLFAKVMSGALRILDVHPDNTA